MNLTTLSNSNTRTDAMIVIGLTSLLVLFSVIPTFFGESVMGLCVLAGWVMAALIIALLPMAVGFLLPVWVHAHHATISGQG